MDILFHSGILKSGFFKNNYMILDQLSFLRKFVWILPFFLTFCSEKLPAVEMPEEEIYHDDRLTDTKMIIAHHMTKNNPYNYRSLYDSLNYGVDKMYKWDIPTFAFYTKKVKTLEEFIEWEIRAAKKLGLDGFEMFYPHNSGTLNTDMATYDKVIISYLRVIQEKNLDFKITLSLSHPTGHKSTEQLATEIAGRLRKYFDAVPNAKAWIKTPDGRYLWNSFGLDEIVLNMGKPFYTSKVEDSYAIIDTVMKKIEQKAGIKIALVYHLREVTGMKKQATGVGADPKLYYMRNINAIYDHFAGISGFADVIYDESLDYWGEIFKIAKARKKTYYQSIFLDYGKVRDYLAYLPSRGSWHLQKLFEMGIEQKSDIIRIMTWNDYPESHHLQPGLTHNFGFGILMNYYKNVWKGESSKNNEDIGIIFTKKYNPVLEPTANKLKVAYFTHILPDAVFQEYLAMEDRMNVVTLLKAPGEIFINDVKVGTGNTGLTSLFIPLQPGPVRLTVKRDGINVVDFTTAEWITDKPLRTDCVTYTYSSKFDEYYNYIFSGYFNGRYYTSKDYAGIKKE